MPPPCCVILSLLPPQVFGIAADLLFRVLEKRRNRLTHMEASRLVSAPESSQKPVNFTPAIEFAKSGRLADIAAKLSFQVGKHRLSYEELCDIFERVRKENNLRRRKRERKLPQLLTEADLGAFFKAIESTEHEIMMRFLLYTAIRVNELVNVKVSDVDLGNCKVFIDQGKGQKCCR